MPTVPTYTSPQVSPDSLPGVKQQTPYRMMQGAELGPGQTMKAGHALLEAGVEQMKEATTSQIQQNEARAKEYDANLMGAIQGVLYDPDNGYLATKGKNALDTYDATLGKLQGIGKDLAGSLDNPAQQESVKVLTQTRLQAALVDAQRHRTQQADVYDTAAGKTRIKAAQDQAALAYNPLTDAAGPSYDPQNPEANSSYQQSLQTIRAEASALADKQGLTDPDVRDALVRDAMAKAYAGTLSHLIDRKGGSPGDLKVAQKYFDTIKSELPAEVQDKVRAVLEAGATKDQALTVALDVKSRVGGIDAQEKTLDQLFKDGTIKAEVHEMALQKLRADNSQRRAEQAETDKAVIGRIWDQAKNGGSLADLPPSTLAYVINRGLGSHVDAIFTNAGKATFDDSRTYADLARMSAEDPASFVKMDLATMSGQLTRGHLDHLIGVQTSINRQDVKAMEANKVVHTALQDTKAQLVTSGFNMNPKPNTGDAAKLAQFEASLRDTLTAAQEARKDKPLTREEARVITMGILKDQALSGTGYFGTSIGQSHMPVWQMTPDQRAADWDVPAQDREQITSSLQRAKLPVTEANIQRAYKLNKGAR